MADFVHLISSCIPVKGYLRSIIINTTTNQFIFIPNNLVSLVKNKWRNLTVNELRKNKDFDNILNFLQKNEMVILISKEEFKCFPPIKLHWEYPAKITNSIIDISSNLNNIENFCYQLNELNCEDIQIRIFNNSIIPQLKNLLEVIKKNEFNSIQLIIPENNFFTNENYQSIIKENQNIHYIVIYNSIENNMLSSNLMGNIIKTVDKISNSNNCGNINPMGFTCNMKFLTESQQHNTCLNRKISIDENGEIKNCPACSKSYGNIKDTTLQEAIEKPGFKDLWYITKDMIDVCKDCEFRHICTDCRVFIKDPENIYSQPSKCTYNPYIAKWQGEDGYLPVEECGTYSKEKGFVPNKRKINKINKVLWGD